jgi:hypothetical protein
METQKLRTYQSLAMVAGALLLSGSPALAASADGERSNAVATFTAHDPTGCISTETSVFVRKDASRREKLELRILKINECTDDGLLDLRADRFIPDGSFRLSPDQSTAWLNVSTSVSDKFSNTEFPASIVLKWKAEGRAATATTSEESTSAGKFARSLKLLRRTIRHSEASGTVYFKNTGMTLKSADSAWIDHAVNATK